MRWLLQFLLVVSGTLKVNAQDVCQSGDWTEWIDDENGATVDPELGEFEYLPDLRLLPDLHICEAPYAIECREVEESQRLSYETGQIVYCDLPEGLVCFHSDNKGDCKNYKIRMCCPPDASENPPVVETEKDELCIGNDLFKMVIQTFVSWHQADMYCKDVYGAFASLANLEKDEVRNAVRELLIQTPGLSDPPGRGYWIGCHDEEEEGSFVWLNGDEVGVPDNAWQRLPNNKYNTKCSSEGHDQDCCQLWDKPRDSPKFRMDDDCCARAKAFICEVPEYCGST